MCSGVVELEYKGSRIFLTTIILLSHHLSNDTKYVETYFTVTAINSCQQNVAISQQINHFNFLFFLLSL